MKYLVLFVLLSLVIGNANAISLAEAVKQKLVTAQVISNDVSINDHYASSHTGPCMHLLLKNISAQEVDVTVETGQTFIPDDSSMQPMLVTKHAVLQLLAGKSKDGYIYAMCFNVGKRSPGAKAAYKVGKVATGALLQTAQYVENNNLQEWEGQSLVWEAVSQGCFDCLFIKKPSSPKSNRHVVLWDSATVYHDREVVGGEYHKLSPDSVAKVFNGWYTKVDVKLTYVLHETSKVTVQLTDENGKIIKNVYTNVEKPAGTYNVNETLVIDNEWKLKRCKLYLYVNGKIQVDKEIHINPGNGVGF